MARTNRDKMIERIKQMNNAQLATLLYEGVRCNEKSCPVFKECENNDMGSCYAALTEWLDKESEDGE